VAAAASQLPINREREREHKLPVEMDGWREMDLRPRPSMCVRASERADGRTEGGVEITIPDICIIRDEFASQAGPDKLTLRLPASMVNNYEYVAAINHRA
jgi:hypothetical protein